MLVLYHAASSADEKVAILSAIGASTDPALILKASKRHLTERSVCINHIELAFLAFSTLEFYEL